MPIVDLPDDTKLIYANWMRVNGTVYDVGIDFGYIDEKGPPDAYPVRVVMTWEHARLLLGLLERNLSSYEEQVRPVPDFETSEDVSDGD
jgi:hypothetical protein